MTDYLLFGFFILHCSQLLLMTPLYIEDRSDFNAEDNRHWCCKRAPRKVEVTEEVEDDFQRAEG
jgi:hypothetical protein